MRGGASFVLAVLVAAGAGAAELFVDTTGSGSACSQSSPCTLATALAQVTGGDTVYVAGGTYTGAGEQVLLLDRAPAYTLQGGWNGAGGGAVIVDPAANATILDGQNARRVITITTGSPTIRGFTIRRGNATSSTTHCETLFIDAAGCGGGIFSINAIPVIEDNVIEDNVASSLTPPGTAGYGGGIMVDYNWPTIRDNVVRNNTASLDGTGRGGGIALHICTTSTSVQANEISSNRASAAAAGSGGGVYATYGTVSISDNLIEANLASPLAGSARGAGVHTYLGAPSISRNRVVGNVGDSAVEIDAFSQGRFSENRVTANRTSTALAITGDSESFRFPVTNNFISDGASTNVALAGSAAHGLDALLIHNTIVGDGANAGVDARGHVDAQVVNTIVAWHEVGIAATATDTVAVDGALFWRNGDDGIRGVNAVEGNPNFVDLFTRDYHLRIGSSAVDTAAGTGVVVTGDIDGCDRPAAGTRADIGADELPPTRFDFGTAGSPLEPGYTRATEATRRQWYNGWGWAAGTVASRTRAAGSALTRDFNMTAQANFAVQVVHGVYDVIARFGDTSFAHDQMQVRLEGAVVDTISTAKGEIVTRTWRTTTDSSGELNLVLEDKGGADANAVINALEVRNPTIVKVDFGTAGSPAAPGWSRASHLTAYSDALRHGWVAGTVGSRDRGGADPLRRDFCLSANATFRLGFLPPESYIVTLTAGDAAYAHDQMELHAGGAYDPSVSTAAGEYRDRPFTVGLGFSPGSNLDVVIKDNGGSDANAVLNAVEVEPRRTLQLDFGSASSPVDPQSVRATAARYRARDGFGWVDGAVVERDRGIGTALVRDLVATTGGTFVVDVPRGTYFVGVALGDMRFAHDQMKVTIQGTDAGTHSTAASEVKVASSGATVTDGQLSIVVEDLGGADLNVAVLYVSLRP